jgi:hypothetical protein
MIGNAILENQQWRKGRKVLRDTLELRRASNYIARAVAVLSFLASVYDFDHLSMRCANWCTGDCEEERRGRVDQTVAHPPPPVTLCGNLCMELE